ncbi:MAG: hypothetical protein JXR96_22315 [Deltaproteobacteria bacterium]|nr:hypothetical protein [Deltaproteobacteria bacterium]
MSFRIALVSFLIAVSSPISAREVLMFARSSGYWQSYVHPGKYSPLNLVDKDKKTVWCSEGSGADARIVFEFADRVAVDRVEVFVGHSGMYAKHNRVRRMEVSDGRMMGQTIELEDKQGFQSIELTPTLEAERVVFKLLAGYRGSAAANRHTCITDIVLYDGSTPLNGPKLRKHFKWAKAREVFLDTWIAGPEGAPNRKLVLGMDGSFRFRFDPSDPIEKQIHKKGPWRTQGSGRIELNVDRKWMPVAVERDAAEVVTGLSINATGLSGSYVRRDQRPDIATR